MTIDEAAKKSGLTKRAIYHQIKDNRGMGRYFKRDTMGKWFIDGRLVKNIK